MKRKMLAVLAAAAVLAGSMPGTAVMAENDLGSKASGGCNSGSFLCYNNQK